MAAGNLTRRFTTGWTKEEAFRYCRRLATTHYENFTVGSLLLAPKKRRHVYAIYAYCRWVDDLGDETNSPQSSDEAWHWLIASLGREPEDEKERRLMLLDRWEEELKLCYEGSPGHPVMVALQDTIKAFEIPQEPFLKLIEANRMDQQIKLYPTYGDLLHYCGHSANPVGHLVLYLFGYRDEERQRLSDYTCTALQLANFWQDVARDYRLGRIYIPLEDIESFGYSEKELAEGVVNDNLRQLMAFEVARARELFHKGLKLVDTLRGLLKIEVALFTLGGLEVLKAIEKRGYDVLTGRPSLSRWQKARLFLRAVARSWGRQPECPEAPEGPGSKR